MERCKLKIAILDTTNYENFPIGGQLASISYFLKYVSSIQNTLDNFLLIGITTSRDDKLGSTKKLIVYDKEISFLPVAYIDPNQRNPKKSFRKAFLYGLVYYINIIKENRINIFYIHSFEAFFPIFFLIKKKKIVYFSHGNFLELCNFIRFGNSSIIKKMMYYSIIFVLKNSDMIFVLDEKTKKQYTRYNKNVFKVSNSIDINFCKGINKERQKNHIKLVFVGRLSKVKNITEIILSFQYLNKNKYELNIVGDGEEYANLSNLIKSNNIESNIHLLGNKYGDQLKEIYVNSDILILNSYSEGFPMVILEALSSGIPVISTHVGCIDEIIVEEYNGEFTNGSPKSIAYKINKISDNLSYYAKNAEATSKEFSYIKINEYIYNLLLFKNV